MNLKTLLLKGTALVGLLLLSACSEKEAPKDYLYKHCATCDENVHIAGTLQPLDSMFFSIPDSCGAIDSNIPPKLVGENLYFKTVKDYVVGYALNTMDTLLKPFSSIQLPDIHTPIADYMVVSDNEFYITTHDDTNFVYRYRVNKGVEEVLNDADTRWDAMPFLGLKFQQLKGKYILPFIPMDEYNKGCYLSVFTENFKWVKSLGEGRDYASESFAPLFDSPIISDIFSDGTFYAIYSSGEQAMKCRITDDWKVEYLDSICFPKSVRHKESRTIPKSKLGDYEFLRKAHNCDRYVARLIADEQRVYRIVKGEQEEIDPVTRRVRTMVQAPWVLDVYNRRTKQYFTIDFPERNMVYSSSFNRNKKEYFLTYESLEKNKVVFVAY